MVKERFEKNTISLGHSDFPSFLVSQECFTSINHFDWP